MGIAIILGVLFASGIAGFGFLAFQNRRKRKMLYFVLSTAAAVVSLFLFIIIPFGFTQVDAGEMAVVKRYGTIIGVETSGIHFRNILTTQYEIYEIRTQQLDSVSEVYTKDGQPLTLTMTVQISVNVEKIEEIERTYGSLEVLKLRFQNIAIEKAKVVLAEKSSTELIETRNELSPAVLTQMKTLENQYFVTVSNVALTDLAFSDAFEAAIEEKMKVEQEKLREQFESERKIIAAEAEKKIAEIEADIKLLLARGEADALRAMQDAWSGLTAEVKDAILRQLAIEKWDGKMPSTVVGEDFFEMLFGALQP